MRQRKKLQPLRGIMLKKKTLFQMALRFERRGLVHETAHRGGKEEDRSDQEKKMGLGVSIKIWGKVIKGTQTSKLHQNNLENRNVHSEHFSIV